jgi:hypothetical protein
MHVRTRVWIVCISCITKVFAHPSTASHSPKSACLKTAHAQARALADVGEYAEALELAALVPASQVRPPLHGSRVAPAPYRGTPAPATRQSACVLFIGATCAARRSLSWQDPLVDQA